MICLDNWNKLKSCWGKNFLSDPNYNHYMKIGSWLAYINYFSELIRSTENEIEVNFLSIKNSKTCSTYILNCYEEVIERIRLNGFEIDLVMRDKNNKNAELELNILHYQNDHLFGLGLWFRINPLLEKILGSESIVLSTKKWINKNDEFELPKKFSMPHYALFQVYIASSGEGEAVTNINKDEIASSYGYNGHKFYQEFNRYRHIGERTNLEGAKIKDKNKVERQKKVIELLAEYPKALSQANIELKALLDAFYRHYE